MSALRTLPSLSVMTRDKRSHIWGDECRLAAANVHRIRTFAAEPQHQAPKRYLAVLATSMSGSL